MAKNIKHEALVEEKRKSTDNEVSTSKNITKEDPNKGTAMPHHLQLEWKMLLKRREKVVMGCLHTSYNLNWHWLLILNRCWKIDSLMVMLN